MTRTEFIERWREVLAGMAYCGWADTLDEETARDDGKPGVLAARGKRLLATPKRVESLLGRMYDDISKEKPTVIPNGTTGAKPTGNAPATTGQGPPKRA
jgi:hypothetical protein